MGSEIHFKGSVCGVSKSTLGERIKDCQTTIDFLSNQLLGLAMMNPIVKPVEDDILMPHEWIPAEVQRLLDELIEQSIHLALLIQADEDPEAEESF